MTIVYNTEENINRHSTSEKLRSLHDSAVVIDIIILFFNQFSLKADFTLCLISLRI